jgi:hypothetical protein
LVQQWNFEEMAKNFLLDPVLFGNISNLVNNKSNPFGLFSTPEDRSDQELLGSCWQSETYELWISEPDKEFLLPLELYIDKTGKASALQLYCGAYYLVNISLTQNFW